MLCKNSIASIYHGKLINLVLIWEQTRMKYTKNKMLWYIKTIFFLVKHLNVVAECCLNWPFFHGALYCCVRYSNIECQDEIFKTYHKKYCSKGNGWNLVLDINFMTLNILKLDFSPIILEFFIYLRALSQIFVEKHEFHVILSYSKPKFRQLHVQYTYLHTTFTIFKNM